MSNLSKAKLSKPQQSVIDLMRSTGEMLVNHKYRTQETGDVDSYSVGSERVNARTARSLKKYLEGGRRDIEAMGHVVVRRYSLPVEES